MAWTAMAAGLHLSPLVRCLSSPPPSTPLLEALKKCGEERVAAFHFPGHGRGSSAPSPISKLLGAQLFQFDLPELPGLDNLHAPEAAIADAQQMAAELFGAAATWFLVNGSTCGIHAAVFSCCNPGDYLLLPRNSHFSAFSAMVLAGALPHYVLPCYDSRWEISHGVSAASIQSAIQELGSSARIGAVLLVSPTYFGVCSPVREIAEICHKHCIPLIVDEAHGAHFHFHSRFPPPALEQGADVVVQSTHKVLSSLTQSAMLHLGRSGAEIVSRERIARSLRLLQSSSPSYLLLASLDAARAQMGSTIGDHPLFDAALALAGDARQRLKMIPQLSILDEESITDYNAMGSVKFLDELRITVGLWDLGVTGTAADEFLFENHSVVAELPSLNSITFALGAGTSVSDVDKLVAGFQDLSSRCSSPHKALSRLSNRIDRVEWKMVVSPRDALFAESRRVKAEEAMGLTSAELLSPYPPGTPVLLPGELVSEEALSCLRQAQGSGIVICGASDPTLATLLVLVT